jgi:hypothetical protein
VYATADKVSRADDAQVWHAIPGTLRYRLFDDALAKPPYALLGNVGVELAKPVNLVALRHRAIVPIRQVQDVRTLGKRAWRFAVLHLDRTRLFDGRLQGVDNLHCLARRLAFALLLGFQFGNRLF